MMRVSKVLATLAAVSAASALGIGPAGALPAVQKCSGPSVVTQSGSATLTPGLNATPAKPKIALAIHLFQCTPAATSGGSGLLKSTFTPTVAETCALLNSAHVLKEPAQIVWKNNTSSDITSLTFSFVGTPHLLNVSGKINTGTFAGHTIAGQFRYKPVASPHGNTVTEACANKVAPGKPGRLSIAVIEFFTTKTFVIT